MEAKTEVQISVIKKQENSNKKTELIKNKELQRDSHYLKEVK